MAIDKDALKGIALVSLLVVAGIAALLPLRWKLLAGNKSWLSYLNAMAAGVFLCLGIVHILPEAAEQVGKVMGEKDNDKYRVPYLLAVGSYTVLLCLERAVETYIQKKEAEQRRQVPAPRPTESSPLIIENGGKDAQPQDKTEAKDDCCHGHDHAHGAHEDDDECHEHDHDDEEEHIGHSHSHGNVMSFVLLLALSVHSIVEGVALGVMHDANSTIVLFIAIIGHKWAEALALGVALSKSSIPPRRSIAYVIFYACCSPAGLAVGWATEKVLSSATGFVTACAAGTFVYVGATEIVVEEFFSRSGSENSWRKLLAFFVGLAAIYAVTVWGDPMLETMTTKFKQH